MNLFSTIMLSYVGACIPEVTPTKAVREAGLSAQKRERFETWEDSQKNFILSCAKTQHDEDEAEATDRCNSVNNEVVLPA
ncbi:MAG: hypothetical protein AAGM67_21865, partial [Bacteroidota bacterium]